MKYVVKTRKATVTVSRREINLPLEGRTSTEHWTFKRSDGQVFYAWEAFNMFTFQVNSQQREICEGIKKFKAWCRKHSLPCPTYITDKIHEQEERLNEDPYWEFRSQFI